MSLREVYQSLRDAGLVRSQRQFSREWLRRQPSYVSCCQSRSREPSLEVLLTLYNKVRRLSASPADATEAASQKDLGHLASQIRGMIGRRLQSMEPGGC
jgi:hypothetical protein